MQVVDEYRSPWGLERAGSWVLKHDVLPGSSKNGDTRVKRGGVKLPGPWRRGRPQVEDDLVAGDGRGKKDGGRRGVGCEDGATKGGDEMATLVPVPRASAEPESRESILKV